jgi:hypothetical protein
MKQNLAALSVYRQGILYRLFDRICSHKPAATPVRQVITLTSGEMNRVEIDASKDAEDLDNLIVQ